jgi:hypothetical protein
VNISNSQGLCSFQEPTYSDLSNLLVESWPRLTPCVIVGPSGCGKRLIVQKLAKEYDFGFVEIRVDGGPTLFIDALTSRAALCRENETSIFYFAGIENASDTSIRILHDLVRDESIFHSDGSRFHLPPGVWVVCAIAEIAAARVGRTHWLTSRFTRRVFARAPNGLDCIGEAFAAVIRTLPGDKTIDQPAQQYLASSVFPEGMTTMRRWAELLLSVQGPISATDLARVQVEDLEWLFGSVRYRGQALKPDAVRAWSSKFPADLQSTAVDLVRQISMRYFIGEAQYFQLLQNLIDNMSLHHKLRVAFARWQYAGKSSPKVANQIKNQANWHVLGEISLNKSDKDWPHFSSDPDVILLADDFIGSGTTVSRLLSPRNVLAELHSRYRSSRICIAAIAGLVDGVSFIRGLLRELEYPPEVHVGHLFHKRDACFTPESIVIPDTVIRERFRQFCLSARNEHFPTMPLDRALGFEGVGALVVFSDTVPNNSLPILWYTGSSTWLPLFPASGLG